MLIQWGYNSVYSASKTIYLPISFYATDYVVNVSIKNTSSVGSQTLILAIPYSTNLSNFTIIGKAATANAVGPATEPIYWIAIGRWR